MNALILSGGLGRRLRSVLGDHPKPMATIGEKPFLEYVLLQLRRHGVRRIILCIGYRGELIQEYFGKGDLLSLELRYSSESELLGTGGALKVAESLIETPDFLVLNGDSIFDIDLNTLIRFHRNRQARATAALAKVENSRRYGSVEINNQGEVIRFLEKAHERPGLINAGIYVLHYKVLGSIPQGRPISLEREVLPQLIGRGLYGVSFDSYFVDIGVPENYLKLHADPSRLLAVIA